MAKILLSIGTASFIGYLIWLIVCVKNMDSKIPPTIGMLLSVIMALGGLSASGYEIILHKNPDSLPLQQNSIINCNEPKEYLENEEPGIEEDTVSSNQENDAELSEVDNITEKSEIAFPAPVQLNSYTLKKDMIGNPQLQINATNISNQIVKSLSITVFAYDDEGIPVKVSFYDFSAKLEYSDAIKVGEKTKSSGYWQLYGDYNEMKQIVAILDEVEYFDGTSWVNPNSSTLYSKYNEQILSAGDENILPKA